MIKRTGKKRFTTAEMIRFGRYVDDGRGHDIEARFYNWIYPPELLSEDPTNINLHFRGVKMVEKLRREYRKTHPENK